MHQRLQSAVERQLRQAPVEWHVARIYEPPRNLAGDGYSLPRLVVEWYEGSTELDRETVVSIAETIAAGMGEVHRVELLDGAAEGGYQYSIEVTED